MSPEILNSDKSTRGDFRQSNKPTCATARVPFGCNFSILLRIAKITHLSSFITSIHGLLIDRACSVKLAAHWPRSLLRTETESRSILTRQGRSRPISSYLDQTNLVNKRLIT